jgi:Ca-activated chloride channel family protein
MKPARLAVLIGILAAGSIDVAGQVPKADLPKADQGLELTVVSPLLNSFVSDQVTLEARISPAARRADVKEVLFFVDGAQVCRSDDVQRPRCTWNAGPIVKAHLVRVVATLRSGERVVASSRTRSADYIESVNVRAVQVSVIVQDRRGNFVSGLTRDQFRLREDDAAQTISSFASEDTPLELVLAVDVSGSMGTSIEDLKVAVREFVSQLAATDRVTLVAFNEEMFVLAKRETDAAARERAVDALASWGNTSLYDVIVRSLELLSKQPGRRALVVFSDGEDSSSQTSLDAVDRAVKESDATLFTVALGQGREVRALKDTLERLAEPSGGRAITAEGAADLRRAFGEVLDDLKHQYMLGFESTNSRLDGTYRRLTVDVTGDRYRIRARQGYVAAKP